ncbi:hypothetical protein [Mizugakiibacter sediminis]|nr:hypothetical protein [Mizugakiibacter sediminis]
MERTVGQLEGRVGSIEDRLERIEDKLDSVVNAVQRARGGWWTLMVVGSAAGTLGALLATWWGYFTGGHR